MATYTVSYRGKNGERIEEQFEAPDRNSLFKILADRKISAISVKDGAAPKRKKSSAPSKSLPPSVLRGAVAGIILVVLVGVIYFSCGTREETADDVVKKGNARIKDVAVAETNRDRSHMSDKDTVIGVLGGVDEDECKTNSEGEVFLDGIPVPVDAPMIDVFDTSSDQILAMIKVADGTGRMPPTPMTKVDEKIFLDSLKKPIEIFPSDDDRVKELKERVIALRKDMLALIESGESFAAVIREHERDVEHNYQIRRDTILEAKQIFDSGDVDGARTYVTTMNLALQQLGIKEIDMPMSKEEHIEKMRELVLERKMLKEGTMK